jgi:hypothetical protein
MITVETKPQLRDAAKSHAPSARQTERARQALQEWLARVIAERAVKMLKGSEDD